MLAARQGERDLEVRVSDDGAGVPLETSDELFQPFVSHQKRGTGLGLANVYRIARYRGGQVPIADDRSLGGASFVVRLPIHQVAPAHLAAEDGPVVGIANGKAGGGGPNGSHSKAAPHQRPPGPPAEPAGGSAQPSQPRVTNTSS